MKSSRIFWAVLAATLMYAGTARAQMGMRMAPPTMRGVWNPVVGKGAVYEVTTEDGSKKTLEFAIVGKDADGYWLQMSMESPQGGGEMVIKNLAVVTQGDVTMSKTILQLPGRSPMEISSQMFQKGRANPHADVRGEAQDLGSETITVPGGTFVCEHYRSKDGGDVWLAKDVAPWGVVKSQGKDTTMMLVKVVSDAKDKIVGTPQPFNPMMMMQQPQQ
jgi:hypothetical protein